MFVLNNIKVNAYDQLVIGDVQYPPYWFNDPLERAKVGMIEVPDPVKPDESLFTYVENSDGSYTATPRTTDDISARNVAKDLEQANAMRKTRNYKLADSDWTQVADAPVDKAVWATYRQALRDVTAQSGFPWTITWPDAP